MRQLSELIEQVQQGLQGEPLAELVAGDHGLAQRLAAGGRIHPTAEQRRLARTGLALDEADNAAALRNAIGERIESAEGVVPSWQRRDGGRRSRWSGCGVLNAGEVGERALEELQV